MEQYPDICAEIISIHALRVEGDFFNFFKKILIFYDFYPRPPGGGRLISGSQSPPWRYFYPRPPGGGRPSCTLWAFRTSIFLSTPSGWRATHAKALRQDGHGISIHALRVEGDNTLKSQYYTLLNFYPRPPGGGRLPCCDCAAHVTHFYPRPPGGGRRVGMNPSRQRIIISIHALRVEGDFAEFMTTV